MNNLYGNEPNDFPDLADPTDFQNFTDVKISVSLKVIPHFINIMKIGDTAIV